MNKDKRDKKRKLSRQESVILYCWLGFSYKSGKDGKRLWSGGRSELESCETYLREKNIINSWGNKRPEIIW